MVENEIGECVEKLNDAKKKQLLRYLHLIGLHPRYLLNFSDSKMKNGINRLVESIQAPFACLAALRELIISS